MNIKPISALNIPKFNKIASFGGSKFSCPNLAPLSKDTVSFSGRAELLAESMSDAPQVNICKSVEQNAIGAAYYLYAVMDKYLSDLVEFKPSPEIKEALNIRPTAKKKASGSKVATFELRIKSASSIREKVVSKHAKLHKNEHKKFAGELYGLLTEKFPLSEGIDEKLVIDIIKQQTKHNATAQKSSAYKDAQHHVSSVVEVLRQLNMLDFGNASDDEINSFSKDVIQKLQATESPLILDGKYAVPNSITGAKHYANDVVGARIVMQEGDKDSTDKILKGLKKAVEDGVLTITSVENNIPDESKIPEGKSVSDYEYASSSQIKDLCSASNAKLKVNKSQTGYLAIHINVKFDHPLFKNFNGVFGGYSGEIQIIGRDVEQLKRVEDLCYKFKDKKNAVNVAYKPFKDYFLKYYQGDVKQAFDDYTYKAYLAQRENNSKRKVSSFPTRAELGFKDTVPEELEFKTLSKLYQGCKIVADSQDVETIKKAPSSKEILMYGNFETLKKLIDHKVNR